MLKEIHEQSRSLTDAIAVRINFDDWSINLPNLICRDIKLDLLAGIKIVACGTAAHAGQVEKYYIENLSKIPVEMDIESEYRYRDPLVGKNHIVIAISQSGETADTLGAIE